MATTTSYGTWNNRVEEFSATFETTVYESLGDFADGYDLDGLVHAYRAAINEALPDGVSLNGSEFYGPYHAEDANFDGFELDEDGRLDIKAIVNSIDFWELAAKFDRSA